MTIRMKDIAKDLGLSQAPVSTVLRDRPDISESSRRRVLERVKDLDYIDQHSQTVDRRAAELALNLIESKQTPRTQTTVLEPTLVVRSSTQKNGTK